MPDPNLKRFVKTETVVYSDIKTPLSREGRVVSSNEVMLVAEAAGKLEPGEVSLRKGTSFRKGQLLATVYKDEVELALKARKSNFLTTVTTLLPDIKVDFPDQLDAFTQFFTSIDIDRDLPKLPEVKDEKLKVFLASRNVLSEYYSIQQDEKRLSRHSLYAPFDGTFTQVNIEVGAFVNTGGQIARMIRLDQLEVEVPVESDKSRWIEIGDVAQVYSKNRDEYRQGVVVRKSAFVDANTQARSIFVRVTKTEKDPMLAGEYKYVLFPGQLIKDAMQLPRNAVFNSDEVFTVVDGKLKKRQINILKWDETTLVFNGLEEGSKVVAEPLINVKENSPVGILGEDQPEVTKKGNRQGKPQTAS